MGYAHKVTRVTAYGTSFGGQEIWSTGFYVGLEGADSIPMTQAGIDAVAAAWKTFFENASTNIHKVWKCTGMKAAQLDTSGKTDTSTVVYHSFATPLSGGLNGTPLPAQLTVAATLTSSLGRGIASKGRMFLPGISAGITETGRLDPGYTAAIALQLSTFLTAANSVADMGGVVINASKGRKVLGVAGPGINKAITGVKVGDIYDTQRRRRNGFLEQYSAHAV